MTDERHIIDSHILRGTLLMLCVLLPAACDAQWWTVTRDSAKWLVEAVEFQGVRSCQHLWVESPQSVNTTKYYSQTCNHSSYMQPDRALFSCSYLDRRKERICKRCHRKERLHFYIYERPSHFKSEYDSLNYVIQIKRGYDYRGHR
jgi:hypothetical protein